MIDVLPDTYPPTDRCLEIISVIHSACHNDIGDLCKQLYAPVLQQRK